MSDLTFFALYIVLLIYLGWHNNNRSQDTDDFLLGSRTLTLPAFVATLVTTWYGGILGVGEFVYRYGVSTWVVFGLPYYFFALIYAFWIAPGIRSRNFYSIPDMLLTYFGKKAALPGSVIILFITSPAPYILITAIILSDILHLNYTVAVFAATLFSLIYVYKGGFRSVVQTDKFQFILMFVGFALMLIFLIARFGSPFSLWEKLPLTHKDFSGGMNWQTLLVWFFIASWTFIDPGFHQRAAAAKTPHVARNGILVSIAFWFVFDMMTLWCGLYAVNLLPGAEPLKSYLSLADFVLPSVLKNIFILGLLATTMSTIDSYGFLSAQTFGRDIMGLFATKKNTNDYTRTGLVFTALVALLLIWGIPSVVNIWYSLGSLFIPSLLLPVLSVFFERIRIPAKGTILNIYAGVGVTGGWYLAGRLFEYPLFVNVEPFLPGMLVSIIIYFFSLFTLRRGK